MVITGVRSVSLPLSLASATWLFPQSRRDDKGEGEKEETEKESRARERRERERKGVKARRDNIHPLPPRPVSRNAIFPISHCYSDNNVTEQSRALV